MKNQTYHEKQYIEYTELIREIRQTLPGFFTEYLRAIEPRTSPRTRINYCYDFRVFLQFLIENNPCFKSYTTKDFTLEHLAQVESVDIEEFLDYLKHYTSPDGKEHINTEQGLHRKLASLRSFYYYFNKRQLIKTNPALMVDMPKLHKKEIIRLDYDEVASLLDLVEHGGDNLTGMKKLYYEKNKVRNLAIFTLLLGTGIRISECVGLDITDIDFKNSRIKIVRKGGKEDFVYFGAEVEKALKDYLTESRNGISALAGHEDALFLSIQKRRMTPRAIENLVGEYASQITTIKHITPHKLRSTYGTSLYRETGDIYLVAEVLGHNDVNTTKKHYAALDEDRKRQAAKVVKLREE